MNRFEPVTRVESNMNNVQEQSESAVFAEVRLSPLPVARIEEKSSASMPCGIPQSTELVADLQGTGVIRLPRGPVDEDATFRERVAKPGQGGGNSGTYDDTDANAYRSLQASADAPKPLLQRPSESEMRKAMERMRPIPGESFPERLVRLQEA